MNILIIGATRGIGRQVLEQALDQGQTVTVLARKPPSLDPQRQGMTVLRGDILDAAAVSRATSGQDGVIISIGIPPTWRPVTVFSQGTRNVLAAMQEHGVARLLAVTGIGAGETKGHGGILYDRIFKPLLLKTIYEDKDRQEALIRQSEADGTIIRPGFLTNGPLTGVYRVLTDLSGVTAGKISRADVAHFILQELATRRYLRQTPLLTY
ncbi:MAG: SDR family oxidoreductase [Deltaproteobacteria bacterium]|nr:SDR family oxidoreductase [Deltaproteobacteria bacterium]